MSKVYFSAYVMFTIAEKRFQLFGVGPTDYLYHYDVNFPKMKHYHARIACFEQDLRLLAISSREEKLWFDQHWFKSKNFSKHDIWLDYKRTDCKEHNPEDYFCDYRNKLWYAFPKNNKSKSDWESGQPDGTKGSQDCSIVTSKGFDDHECEPSEEYRKTYVCQSKLKYCNGWHIYRLKLNGIQGQETYRKVFNYPEPQEYYRVDESGSKIVQIKCSDSNRMPRVPNVTSIECIDGVWTGVECIEHCLPPTTSSFLRPVSANAGKSMFRLGEIIVYICKKQGYRFHNGLDKRECTQFARGLQWTDEPKCEAMCSRESLSPNVHINSGPVDQIWFKGGDKLEVYCQIGSTRKRNVSFAVCELNASLIEAYWKYDPFCERAHEPPQKVGHWLAANKRIIVALAISIINLLLVVLAVPLVLHCKRRKRIADNSMAENKATTAVTVTVRAVADKTYQTSEAKPHPVNPNFFKPMNKNPESTHAGSQMSSDKAERPSEVPPYELIPCVEPDSRAKSRKSPFLKH